MSSRSEDEDDDNHSSEHSSRSEYSHESGESADRNHRSSEHDRSTSDRHKRKRQRGRHIDLEVHTHFHGGYERDLRERDLRERDLRERDLREKERQIEELRIRDLLERERQRERERERERLRDEILRRERENLERERAVQQRRRNLKRRKKEEKEEEEEEEAEEEDEEEEDDDDEKDRGVQKSKDVESGNKKEELPEELVLMCFKFKRPKWLSQGMIMMGCLAFLLLLVGLGVGGYFLLQPGEEPVLEEEPVVVGPVPFGPPKVIKRTTLKPYVRPTTTQPTVRTTPRTTRTPRTTTSKKTTTTTTTTARTTTTTTTTAKPVGRMFPSGGCMPADMDRPKLQNYTKTPMLWCQKTARNNTFIQGDEKVDQLMKVYRKLHRKNASEGLYVASDGNTPGCRTFFSLDAKTYDEAEKMCTKHGYQMIMFDTLYELCSTLRMIHEFTDAHVLEYRNKKDFHMADLWRMWFPFNKNNYYIWVWIGGKDMSYNEYASHRHNEFKFKAPTNHDYYGPWKPCLQNQRSNEYQSGLFKDLDWKAHKVRLVLNLDPSKNRKDNQGNNVEDLDDRNDNEYGCIKFVDTSLTSFAKPGNYPFAINYVNLRLPFLCKKCDVLSIKQEDVCLDPANFVDCTSSYDAYPNFCKGRRN